jgi:hypothetical protein
MCGEILVIIGKYGMYIILSVTLVFTLAFTSSLTQVVLAQTQTPLLKYEDPKLGISFQYPAEWKEPTSTQATLSSDCFTIEACSVGWVFTFKSGHPIFIYASKLDETNGAVSGPCNCNTLQQYMKWDYNRSDKDDTFIRDNQTTIGHNYTAWQMEKIKPDKTEKTYVVWAINGNVGYRFSYAARGVNELFTKYLDGFKQLLRSVTFMPTEAAKKPSFLSSPENNTSNLSLTTGIQEKSVKILSSNHFIDSIGVLHVVGEVQNNIGEPIKFVKVIGTFYDSNSHVVATDFTYTNPADIPLDGKAPFDLSLSSASIPVESIDHYNIVTEYNQ